MRFLNQSGLWLYDTTKNLHVLTRCWIRYNLGASRPRSYYRYVTSGSGYASCLLFHQFRISTRSQGHLQTISPSFRASIRLYSPGISSVFAYKCRAAELGALALRVSEVIPVFAFSTSQEHLESGGVEVKYNLC